MTVAELIELTEGLLYSTGLDLKQLRDHGAPAMADDLTDEQFLLAVRFLAGERPEAAFEVVQRGSRGVVISEDEAARRLAELEELDEVLGPVEIGEGITLL